MKNSIFNSKYIDNNFKNEKMENQENKVPYSDWPWWVKILSNTRLKFSNPFKNIVIVVVILLVSSLSISFHFKTIYEMITNEIIVIILANISVIFLWQALAVFWIEKNSSFDIIEKNNRKTIIVLILALLFFCYPLIFRYLQQ